MHWQERIAPVFEVAPNMAVVQVQERKLHVLSNQSLIGQSIPARVQHLLALQVQVLICGAMARSTCQQFRGTAITLIPFISGPLEEIMQAWVEDRLVSDAYAMPGCRRQNMTAPPALPSTPHCCRRAAKPFHHQHGEP